MLGGVAGGLAHYLSVDPVLVRVGWALVAVLTGGAAIVAYVIGWIIIPEEGHDEAARRAATPHAASEHGRFVLGGVLVVAGLLWLAATIVPDIFRFRAFGALVLVAIGILLVVQGARR
jgi:phage shock protein C